MLRLVISKPRHDSSCSITLVVTGSLREFMLARPLMSVTFSRVVVLLPDPSNSHCAMLLTISSTMVILMLMMMRRRRMVVVTVMVMMMMMMMMMDMATVVSSDDDFDNDS